MGFRCKAAFSVSGGDGVNIPEELWCGNIYPNEQSIKKDSEYAQVLRKVIDEKESLLHDQQSLSARHQDYQEQTRQHDGHGGKTSPCHPDPPTPGMPHAAQEMQHGTAIPPSGWALLLAEAVRFELKAGLTPSLVFKSVGAVKYLQLPGCRRLEGAVLI